MFLIVVGSIRNKIKLLGDSTAHRVSLAISDVDGTNEQVVKDVIQVPMELKPEDSH